jgi:hypothetical protein
MQDGAHFTETQLVCGEFITTVEPVLSVIMTSCRWSDNKKSRITEDDPKRPVNALVLSVKII